MLNDYQSVFKAVADATRARILKMLTLGELCVCQIVAVLGLSQSTVSKHLWILKSARLIQDRKDGRWVFYSLIQNGGNQYARFIISNINLWLKDDKTVVEDLKRLGLIREVPLEEIRLCGSEILKRMTCR